MGGELVTQNYIWSYKFVTAFWKCIFNFTVSETTFQHHHEVKLLICPIGPTLVYVQIFAKLDIVQPLLYFVLVIIMKTYANILNYDGPHGKHCLLNIQGGDGVVDEMRAFGVRDVGSIPHCDKSTNVPGQDT